MAVCPVYSLAEAERRRSYSKPLGQPLSDIYMAVDLDRGKERERKRERKREREKDRERERERDSGHLLFMQKHITSPGRGR